MAQRKEVMEFLVKEEVRKLRKYATGRELNRLSFTKLNPRQSMSCIYGQMCEGCFNSRAVELMKKSCSRVYKNNGEIRIEDAIGNAKVNGSPKDIERGEFWSPIEVFILQPKNQENGNNKILIDYLKGKINRLNFAKF